ncbi:hypothetical protein HGO38_10285 [Rhizobium sp. CG5]|uniref:hypothetical protein n=1 Tax=Rhizobium sp. CG5 TaxID=2726076 RepID=UPI0020340048|nr:hypothetical protein [Rhizobium sp. CG5]MCM2473860.1 hypothetical protein [Rhizobium sp. CG5]
MKVAAALCLGILLLSGPAEAISRYNLSGMTCEGARQAIRNEGAVILRHPSKRVAGMTLYDRYVRDSRQCDPGEYAEWNYVPTKDSPRCPVLACEPIPDRNDRLFLPHYSL